MKNKWDVYTKNDFKILKYYANINKTKIFWYEKLGNILTEVRAQVP